jgi:hypothetical protein
MVLPLRTSGTALTVPASRASPRAGRTCSIRWLTQAARRGSDSSAGSISPTMSSWKTVGPVAGRTCARTRKPLPGAGIPRPLPLRAAGM